MFREQNQQKGMNDFCGLQSQAYLSVLISSVINLEKSRYHRNVSTEQVWQVLSYDVGQIC